MLTPPSGDQYWIPKKQQSKACLTVTLHHNSKFKARVHCAVSSVDLLLVLLFYFTGPPRGGYEYDYITYTILNIGLYY